MHVTSKSGRKIYIPDDKENKKINAGIKADPDTYEVEDFSTLRKAGRPVSSNKKDRITIRLSKDVTRYFKSTGPGWQTRINEVLLKHIKSH